MTSNAEVLGARSYGTRLLGHTDMNGFGDGMHVNLYGDYAYVGNMGYHRGPSGYEPHRVGTTIVNIADVRAPETVGHLRTPVGTHSHKVQVVDDLLLVNYERSPAEFDSDVWTAGLKIYSLENPAEPREIGFLPMSGSGNRVGVHRMSCSSMPYVYMSGSDDGFTDQFLIIADISDPTRPREVGRYWYPGMNAAAGETPTWSEGERYACHHALLDGTTAYCGWWDAGVMVLDVADPATPVELAHLTFDDASGGRTHTTLPIPGTSLLAVTHEAVTEEPTRPLTGREPMLDTRIIDIADLSAPRELSKLPVPPRPDGLPGGTFGPHNLHEMRPGSYSSSTELFLSYFRGGVRIYDIADPASPRETAAFIPETPEKSEINDVFVDARGLIFATERFGGGLYIVERT